MTEEETTQIELTEDERELLAFLTAVHKEHLLKSDLGNVTDRLDLATALNERLTGRAGTLRETCPECGAQAWHRKMKTPTWKCANGHEFEDP